MADKASGVCMCGHASSLHTGPGTGCQAKYYDRQRREQVECPCTFFQDRDG